MQFVVFAAFVIVLSVPDSGAPWTTLTSPLWMWFAVVGQVLAVTVVAAMSARRVMVKLDREPAWLAGAHQALARGHGAIRIVLVAGLAASVYGTNWAERVRSLALIQPIYGLDELVILMPFFVAMFVSWVVLYPADRAIRQVSLEHRLWLSEPTRPVWGLKAYLSSMLRHHVLVISLPMVLIVAVNDFVSPQHFGPVIRKATGVIWADQAVLVMVAGLVFLVAPIMLKYIWQTRRLPRGPLRDRLEALCRRVGLTYRDILIWQSDGMVVNAAVMGLMKPVRYILLSDGLLETMEDERIEAVFGHEAGHVKHMHIPFYLLFAIVSMLIVGGISELVMRFCPDLIIDRAHTRDYLQVFAMAMIVVLWGVGFGIVSRRFELQADLFGARSVTPASEACRQPCVVHGTAVVSNASGQSSRPLCATAASLFADSLRRIAELNGIPIDARSWRHSSIANRIQLLKQYAVDPTLSTRLERGVLIIKVVLLIGTIIGLAIGAWLYWPRQWNFWE